MLEAAEVLFLGAGHEPLRITILGGLVAAVAADREQAESEDREGYENFHTLVVGPDELNVERKGLASDLS